MATASNISGINEESTETKKTFIRKAHELFRICDKNDNGFISKRDMWMLRDELSLTPQELEEVFINLDEDKSDYLTEEEFVQGFASYLGVDLNKLKKEEEEETKRKAEQEEDEEFEDLLNRIDEHAIEDEAQVDKLWNTLRKKNPGLTTSEFENVIEDLRKGMRTQRIDNQKEVRKDFFSLHKYYYKHIHAVMQHAETAKHNETNRKLWESLDPAKTNKPLKSLLQRDDQNNIRFNGVSTVMINDKDNLPSAKQQPLISPPVKTRKRFLKSVEESSSSTSQEEAQHNSSNPANHSFLHNDYKDHHPPNNHIQPIINCPERLFKIIFLGDSNVGKTSFIHRFCCDQFLSTYQATVGIDYRVNTFAVEGHLIALQLWDTAGQERYRSIVRQYFRKTDGVIFMYDVTSELSFRNVRNWMAQVKEHSDNNLVSATVGNKIDLSPKERPIVTTENGKELAKKHESLFCETSCKTGEGIWNVMNQMACALKIKEDQEIEKIYELQKFKEPKKCC